jgi:hypothetical protein
VPLRNEIAREEERRYLAMEEASRVKVGGGGGEGRNEGRREGEGEKGKAEP